MKKFIKCPLLGLLILLCSCNTETQNIAPTSLTVDRDPTQYGIPFYNIPKTENIVMYEINIGAFSKSGDLKGITSKLDYISSLGVNTIWLMPIYQIGVKSSFGSPYCVRNYREVNINYGNLEDLRTLVTEAHSRNIAVVLDWVANHSSWDNTWISNRSWYSQDTSGNIISPAGTDWSDVADLNYSNSDMRIAMISAMKYWVLTANIDGFRCDAADLVPYDFWKQALDSLKSLKNRSLILLAEGSRLDHYSAGFQMTYGWNFLSALKNVFVSNNSARTIFSVNTSEYSSIPSNTFKLRFTTNHDESGSVVPVSLFKGVPGALAASTLAIFLHGVPLLYSGQEVGVANPLTYSSLRPIDWSQNPDMLATYRAMLGFYNISTVSRIGILQVYPDNDVVVFTKSYLDDNVLILVNTRNITKTFTLPTALANSSWINVIDLSHFFLGTTVSLSPYQCIILKK